MPVKLPLWARKLLDRHPGAELPSPQNPAPLWLKQELTRVPLWAFIRGVDDVRREHPYFLIEDVRSQPQLMRQTLSIGDEIAAVAQRLSDQGVEHLVFTGCGSAYFNSLFAAFLFRNWCGAATEAVESLEFTNYWTSGRRQGKTALVAQSATGGSIETLDALRRARKEGLVTVGITNTCGSAMDELCDETIAFPTAQRCGPDVSVITTRLMLLYLLALRWGEQRGAISAERGGALRNAVFSLPEVAERFLQTQEARLADLAGVLKDQQALLFVGGGPNWFSARESTLKVEEECSMVCKAYRPAEYPHDAIALLSPQVTTVVIAPPGPSYGRLHDCLRTGQAAGSRGVALVNEDDRAIATDANDAIRVPGSLGEMFFPPLATIFAQTLGYYLGIERGFNPDTLRTDDLSHAVAWLTSFPLGTH
jgi:glucosamine--fructose-6-phosphate aminotransferase (isomerizing)